MVKPGYPVPPSSEITPESLYWSRRQFIKAAGLAGVAAVLAACAPAQTPIDGFSLPTPGTSNTGPKDELGHPSNSYEDITNFNNFYEFSQDKGAVAGLALRFTTSPWDVEVSGLVARPAMFAIEDLLKQFSTEERIYRLRCVEGWSMVIPWSGFPLARLLQAVEPLAAAKFVRFTSAVIPDQMPGLRDRYFTYPYVEGLRLDEAMNELTLLATGLYGKPLPGQDGAPIRLVVPWKYGFKSAKSLVKIELVAEQPKTFWSTANAGEYGFYANVNPQVPHPRWSQATERRLGENGRRPTLLFNGYADQVGSLYAGMDLRRNF